MAVSKKRKKNNKAVKTRKLSVYPEAKISTAGAKIVNKYKEAVNGFNMLHLDQLLDDVSEFMDGAQEVLKNAQENYIEEDKKERENLELDDMSISEVSRQGQISGMQRLIAQSIVRDFINDGLGDIVKNSHDNYMAHLKEIIRVQTSDKKALYVAGTGSVIKHLEFISHNCINTMSKLVDQVINTVLAELQDYEDKLSSDINKQSLYRIKSELEKERGNSEVIDLLGYLADHIGTDDYDFEEISKRLLKALFENNNNDIEIEKEIIKKKKASYSKTKMYKYQELNKIAEENGFELLRHNGDHGIWSRQEPPATIIIPQGREIGRGLQLRILKTLTSN